MTNQEYSFRTGTPEAEDQITKGSPVSSTPWEEVFLHISIDNEVQGMKILDVGSGASDSIARLLQLGADAYGIEPKYANNSLLRASAKANINQLRKRGNFQAAKAEERALQNFLESYKQSPDRYREARASKLPFEDNFFDLIYSNRALTGYLDLDPFAFARSVDECLRVLKPDGKIILFPIETDSIHFPDSEKVRKMKKQSLEHLGAHLYGKVSSAEIETIEIKHSEDSDITIIKHLVIIK